MIAADSADGNFTSSSSAAPDVLSLPLDVGLVGRDQERLVLEQAYDRVCCRVQEAPSEIVLVEGASGTGKTALVASLRESIDREDMGLFVQGKYDLKSSAPYEALVDAAMELCSAVSASCYLEDVKEHLQSVLSDENDCRLLVNLFPAVQALLVHPISEREPVSPHGSREFALKLFWKVFNKFWNAVAGVHPVILFLDDLQWADTTLKDFLTALTVDMTSTNLLVVGAYRSAEFEWDLKGKSPHWRISKIDLGPLSQMIVNDIVSRATRRRPEETEELGAIIYRKTQGNALFTWQFLDMLQTSGLLFFSFRSNQWEWDTDVAARTDVSDNVAELLTLKISRLPMQAQTILMLAACLGHSFELSVLETIVQSSEDLHLDDCCNEQKDTVRKNFHEAVVGAVKSGLIEQTQLDGRYKFSHDKVQQAAFNLIPDEMDEDRFHADLGERVLRLYRLNEHDDWMLFSAVELLTHSQGEVEASRFSREELAHLCLEASRRAVSKSAFMAAAGYATRGYSLMDPTERWHSNYSLCLELCTLSAETHHSYGDHDGAIKAASEILSNARTIQDKSSAQNVVIWTRIARNDFHGGIRDCAHMLKGLGFVCPIKARRIQVLVQYMKTKRLLNGRRASDLRELPPAKDLKIVQASGILHGMLSLAWVSVSPFQTNVPFEVFLPCSSFLAYRKTRIWFYSLFL